MQLLLKILSEKANSVDPDQTAPDLVLHCLPMPFCQNFDVHNFRKFNLYQIACNFNSLSTSHNNETNSVSMKY